MKDFSVPIVDTKIKLVDLTAYEQICLGYQLETTVMNIIRATTSRNVRFNKWCDKYNYNNPTVHDFIVFMEFVGKYYTRSKVSKKWNKIYKIAIITHTSLKASNKYYDIFGNVEDAAREMIDTFIHEDAIRDNYVHDMGWDKYQKMMRKRRDDAREEKASRKKKNWLSVKL